jgi:hypothetical protein
MKYINNIVCPLLNLYIKSSKMIAVKNNYFALLVCSFRMCAFSCMNYHDYFSPNKQFINIVFCHAFFICLFQNLFHDGFIGISIIF